MLLGLRISRPGITLPEGEALETGVLLRHEDGLIYFPRDWDGTQDEAYPVMVILPGYAINMRTMASDPQWAEGADRYGVVLFFVHRDHIGWHEDRASEDSRRIRRVLRGFRRASWVEEDGMSLFGFSAGAIMGTSFLCQKDVFMGPPLFDKLFAASGGIGVIMEKALDRDPLLRRVDPVPVYLFWGEKEPPFVGDTVQEMLEGCGWELETYTHEAGHWLDSSHIMIALRNG